MAAKKDNEIDEEELKVDDVPLDEEEDTVVVEVPEDEPTLDDLPGVGPATAEKLREAGFDDMLAIAVMSPSALAQ